MKLPEFKIMPICFSYFILRWLSNSEQFRKIPENTDSFNVGYWLIGGPAGFLLSDLPGTQPVFLLFFFRTYENKNFCRSFLFCFDCFGLNVLNWFIAYACYKINL